MLQNLTNFDTILFNWINQGLSNNAFDFSMPVITYLGSIYFFLFFLILLLIAKKYSFFLFSSISFGVVSGIKELIKYAVNRPRPFLLHDVILRVSNIPINPSFPSGHTATAFMIATLLSWKYKKYNYIFYSFAFLVGFSRIYIGVHYPSDVMVGAIIGFAVPKLMLKSKRLARSFGVREKSIK
ncbi:MAG TPA: phosphatase PAP2 family protein [Methanosarcinales archaeon]|nr:phosphatase PAP2 family protein [Methanosarcinales archaeon]